jgi:hypothetical protein
MISPKRQHGNTAALYWFGLFAAAGLQHWSTLFGIYVVSAV